MGFWLGIDWLIQLPVLFAFAARGSLLNTYFGVKYGTMLKWHRYACMRSASTCHHLFRYVRFLISSAVCMFHAAVGFLHKLLHLSP